MDAARQAGIKASHRAHDVDAFKILGPVLLKNRRVLHCVLVWSGSPIDVAWVGIPTSRRVGMVVCNLAVSNYQVMREHASHGLVETAPDSLFRHGKWSERLCPSGVQFRHRPLDEIEGGSCSVSLEVGASAVAFDGIAPLGDLPLKFNFGLHRRLRQHNFYAVARRFYITDVYKVSQCSRPEPRDRTAACIQGQMIICALIIPSWRHDPGVLISKVAFLRFGNRRLVPRMVFIHWVPERIMGDKGFLVLPVFVVRRTKQNPQPEVDIDQVGGDQLAVHYYARGDVHRLAPLVHRPVIVVAYIRILERTPAAEKNPP